MLTNWTIISYIKVILKIKRVEKFPFSFSVLFWWARNLLWVTVTVHPSAGGMAAACTMEKRKEKNGKASWYFLCSWCFTHFPSLLWGKPSMQGKAYIHRPSYRCALLTWFLSLLKLTVKMTHHISTSCQLNSQIWPLNYSTLPWAPKTSCLIYTMKWI